MKILFCCQFYAPSVGGVQEVMRQIAERLVRRGHHVTVATAKLPNRSFTSLNGVEIREFDVSGNLVGGMSGEVDEYREFVVSGDFDVMMIKAAQQWTFDALWPVYARIPYARVFIPCGFSGLYEPAYAGYFRKMPEILKLQDHLVFYASQYRDIDFARHHGLTHFSVIPNGASEIDFGVEADATFRARHGIAENSFLFLTVGSFTGLKGHLELVKAFALMKLDEGRHATLILNGNAVRILDSSVGGILAKFVGVVRTRGLKAAFGSVIGKILGKLNTEGTPQGIANNVNHNQPNKTVLITDLSRQDLTQAFMAADLFVFASNIEYSPLVLYEAAAAGTPFLTVSVGNSAEIANWTGAGVMCPSKVDEKGYTRVDEQVLANSMAELMQTPVHLAELGAAGRKSWAERFTWEQVSLQYERIFNELIADRAALK